MEIDQMRREIYAMEKELRSIKGKLDNAIIDMRVVNYWGWTKQDHANVWDVVRHEFQYKRQGDPQWVSIPVVDREEINVPIPNGEYDYHD